MGGGLSGHDQVLGSAQPDPVELDLLRSLAARRRGSRLCGRRSRFRGRSRCRGGCRLRRRLCGSARSRRQIRLDVLPGDPSPVTGAGHLGDVNLVLSDQLAHHRRKQVGLRLRLVGCGEEGVDLGRRGCFSPQRSVGGSTAGGGEGGVAPGCCGGFFDHVGLGWLLLRCGCLFGGFRLGRLLLRRRRRFLTLGTDHDQRRAHRHRVPFVHQDLEDRARCRRWDLGVDLVGGYLDEDLILGDRVAYLLGPAQDCSLGDRLTQLRHRYRRSQGRSSQ